MRYFATLYSIVFGVSASWAWITVLIYHGSTQEHLLPSVLLGIATLPSSLLMDSIVSMHPSLLDRTIAMLSMLTAFGLIQVALVWSLGILIRRMRVQANRAGRP